MEPIPRCGAHGAGPAPASITAVILTFNEAAHIARCIESIAPLVARIVVVDSFSTDETLDIARRLGAETLQHEWRNPAQQLQWGVDAAKPATDWILRLDADEYFEPALRDEIVRLVPTLPAEVTGLRLKRKFIFRGVWIRHGGYYPTRLLRVWRRGCGRVEQRWMDEHIVLTRGRAINCDGDFVDHNLHGLTRWIDKHNRYATLQMVDYLNLEFELFPIDRALEQEAGAPARRKRFLRNRVYARAPLYLRAILYFCLRYFFRFGVLDGREGFVFHFLQGLWYPILIDAKIDEARRYVRRYGVEAFRARLKSHYNVELDDVDLAPMEAIADGE
jgi:glycosyltransferase involved in cell wall biosynthesis